MTFKEFILLARASTDLKPSGIEVFYEQNVDSEHWLKKAYDAGREHALAEIQKEKSLRWDALQDTFIIQPIKLPWWKRWSLIRNIKNVPFKK